MTSYASLNSCHSNRTICKISSVIWRFIFSLIHQSIIYCNPSLWEYWWAWIDHSNFYQYWLAFVCHVWLNSVLKPLLSMSHDWTIRYSDAHCVKCNKNSFTILKCINYIIYNSCRVSSEWRKKTWQKTNKYVVLTFSSVCVTPVGLELKWHCRVAEIRDKFLLEVSKIISINFWWVFGTKIIKINT